MSGPRIPGYTYLQHLGSGGFADVFLYEQAWPQQRVAVKVVRAGVTLTDHEKSLFTSEANAMARLADHPYIVDVITAGVTDPEQGARPYLVMRYCPPPDLGARVRAQPMTVPEAVSTGIKLASAIETAHRAGILHRDIKPSNVLVTTYQEPALTDFGIAGHVSDVDQEHEIRISYPWAPVEMIEGTSNGSVASDVYSLGATIWNLLTGRSPFSVPGGDNSSHALTTRALHAAPPSLQRPDAPPALDRLLQMCLAKRPELRPRSALELARELQRIESAAGYSRTPIAVAGDQPVVTATPPPDAGGDATALKPVSIDVTGPGRPADPAAAPVPGPPKKPVSRATTVWGAVGTVVLFGLVVALVTMLGGSDRPDRPADIEPDPSFTPSDVVPEAPIPEPAVRGRRSGRDVTFTWRVVGGTKAGDTWVWRRPDTGETARGTEQRLTVTASRRVCLQVQLIRDGEPSTSTQKCVE
ncbi:serine/threonine-protein kinase [Nocardioides sp.]|uniref:serine/threonine-protein kinase n=1 Tax=Nocardioides sp. TaxID=35761 RepID=UPI002ED4830B